ncbi:MAG TPA: hypothetical protein PLA50_18740, partial [Bacteroidia bacterium]|nr:hypothetical protein [Bacteroidia bacterium]
MPFEVIRKGKKLDLTVKLGDLDDVKTGLASSSTQPGGPGAASKDVIDGVVFEDLSEETRSSLQAGESVQGVLVKSVQDDSSAAEAGLRPGMVITQIDQV